MASWTRAHWLYLYLAIVMAVCFLMGNAAHSQDSQASGASMQAQTIGSSRYSQDPFYRPLEIAPETERYQLMNYFASGQSFYLDKDSFKPSPDGTLQYTTIGKNLYATNGKDIPNQRSGNVVDCRRGMFISQTSRELLNENGEVISRDTFETAQPKTLTPSTPLYGILKDACKENFQNNDFSQWH